MAKTDLLSVNMENDATELITKLDTNSFSRARQWTLVLDEEMLWASQTLLNSVPMAYFLLFSLKEECLLSCVTCDLQSLNPYREWC